MKHNEYICKIYFPLQLFGFKPVSHLKFLTKPILIFLRNNPNKFEKSIKL